MPDAWFLSQFWHYGLTGYRDHFLCPSPHSVLPRHEAMEPLPLAPLDPIIHMVGLTFHPTTNSRKRT